MKKVLVFVSIVLLVSCLFSCVTPIPTTEKHRFGGQEKVADVVTPAPVAAPVATPAPEAAPAPVPEAPKALSEFPAGKWLDANWDALWVFFADGSVKLYDSNNGDLIYDFDGQIKDFKLEPAGLGLKMSFRCDDTKRFYVFTKDVEGTDLNMDIDRDWTAESYNIDMPLQE